MTVLGLGSLLLIIIIIIIIVHFTSAVPALIATAPATPATLPPINHAIIYLMLIVSNVIRTFGSQHRMLVDPQCNMINYT